VSIKRGYLQIDPEQTVALFSSRLSADEFFFTVSLPRGHAL